MPLVLAAASPVLVADGVASADRRGKPTAGNEQQQYITKPLSLNCDHFNYVVEESPHHMTRSSNSEVSDDVGGDEAADEDFGFGICTRTDGEIVYLTHLPHIYQHGATAMHTVTQPCLLL